MRFDEHPTWKMLENGKAYFKYLIKSSDDIEIALTAEAALHSLHRLQLALENDLIEKFGGPDE